MKEEKTSDEGYKNNVIKAEHVRGFVSIKVVK